MFVALFSVLVVITAVVALPELAQSGSALTGRLPLDEQNFTFYIAFAGWMPTGLGASVTLSLWVCAKSATQSCAGGRINQSIWVTVQKDD